MLEIMFCGTKVIVLKGDITKEDTEAIVNAANSSLLGGGGVDGAIHRSGGPKILEQCKEIRKTKGTCSTGEAVITTGGNLNAKYVIHTVGPIWQGGNKNEPQLLQNAYRNSLNLAYSEGIKSISFPSISTGVYGYPIEKASIIALETTKDIISKKDFDEIRFILFSEKDYKTYIDTLKNIFEKNS
ncbi:O-acetyl-ADP-ribose deacetylase [Clostridiisalibacter paucivorans]|uniref:O-acetyl-ADP-ribose deacetylase n=1 Tax=Clostridiisalibacter paucivorans TaxID=408753 RepID=UPI00047EB444|nr:O-acetyl-ADP-ribose deacetylase [Clostridiisalibacter paucivorans]